MLSSLASFTAITDAGLVLCIKGVPGATSAQVSILVSGSRGLTPAQLTECSHVVS